MGLLGPTSTTDDDVCNARMPAASYTIYIHLEWEISIGMDTTDKKNV